MLSPEDVADIQLQNRKLTNKVAMAKNLLESAVALSSHFATLTDPTFAQLQLVNEHNQKALAALNK